MRRSLVTRYDCFLDTQLKSKDTQSFLNLTHIIPSISEESHLNALFIYNSYYKSLTGGGGGSHGKFYAKHVYSG